MATKITISNENESVNPLLKTAKTVAKSVTLTNSDTVGKTQQINLLKSRVLISGDTETVPKLPDPLKMDYGRLAVNYAKGYETLSTKNDNDEIVEFKSIDYIKNLLNNTIGEIHGLETNSIKTNVVDKGISSDLKLSSKDGNILTIEDDGLHTSFTMRYGENSSGVSKPGLLIIETPNGFSQSVNLPLESFLVGGGYYEQYYDKSHQLHRKVIVLIVRDENGDENEIIIPVSDIVNIYTFNGDGKCIKVTTTPSSTGTNEYIVDISLIKSPKSNNIFESTVDGAFVEDFRPYIEEAKESLNNDLRTYIDTQDQYYDSIAKQDASAKANQALTDAKNYADELDSKVMHLSGGSFTGNVTYENGSANIYKNGATNTYLSGSTARFEFGSDIVTDEKFQMHWGNYILGKDNFTKWDNMMPTSGGIFTGNVMFDPNANQIFEHESGQIFKNNSTQTFEGGSTINHENNSNDNYNYGSTINHNEGSSEKYNTGSTIDHEIGSIENHNDGSTDNYNTGSIVNFKPGSTENNDASITNYTNASEINLNGGTSQNFNDNSTSNFNSGSTNNFNQGSSQNFDCDSAQNFKCNSNQNFSDNSVQNFNSGTTSVFHNGSKLIFENGSNATHEKGSVENYEDGSVVNLNSGATTNHNGDTNNFNSGSTSNYNSGSTQNIQSGSSENFNGGAENFNSGATSNFNCDSSQNFKCNASQNFTENASSNFSGSSSQHFNSGTTSEFHNGSNLIFDSGSNETHNSGSTTTFLTGATENFDGGTLNFNCDSSQNFKCNASQNFTENSTSNFNGNSEQNFNNGTSQNFNSGATQEFFEGSNQIFHNGSSETHESGSTTVYQSGSTLTFNSGATTDHNGDTTNYNSGATINYGSGSTQNIQSGSSINFDYGSNLEFTCADGTKSSIDCERINHWNDATDPDENNPDSLKNWVMNWVEDYVDGVIGDLVTDLSKEYMPISGGTFTGGVNFSNNGLDGALTGITVDSSVPINIHSSHVDFYDGTVKFNYSTVEKVQIDCPIEMLRTATIANATITNSLTTDLASQTTFNGTTTFNNDTVHNRTITFPVKQGAYATNADIICQNGGPTQGITNIDCSGSIDVADGGYQQPSDKRLKENIEELQLSLNDIEKLSTIYFNYVGSEGKIVGVIAQEVQEICPEIVKTDENGFLKVDYVKLSVIALKGVKLLSDKVKKQNRKIKKINNKVNKILKYIELNNNNK